MNFYLDQHSIFKLTIANFPTIFIPLFVSFLEIKSWRDIDTRTSSCAWAIWKKIWTDDTKQTRAWAILYAKYLRQSGSAHVDLLVWLSLECNRSFSEFQIQPEPYKTGVCLRKFNGGSKEYSEGLNQSYFRSKSSNMQVRKHLRQKTIQTALIA